MKNKGLFVTIEGGERAGKSTLIQNLYAYFTDIEKRLVIKSFEPGGTPFGKMMRNILLNQDEVAISGRAELLLFLADRAHHVETVIKPNLALGAIVLVDRFTDSSLAYQGIARKVTDDFSRLEDVCLFAAHDLVPDVTIYLDLDPEVGLSRILEGKDRLEREKIEFHKKVRAGYLELAGQHPDRIHVIKGTDSIEGVFEKTLQVLKQAGSVV